MTFPGFSELFVIDEGPKSDRDFRAVGDVDVDWWSVSRGEAAPPSAPTFRWASGAPEPGPVVWTTNAHPLILGSSIVADLVDAGLTGIATFPVVIEDRSGATHQDYAGLVVQGRVGDPDLARSEIVLEELRGGFFPTFVGSFFDPDSWDGHDLSVPAGSLTRVATRRAADLLTAHARGSISATPLPATRTASLVYEIGNGRELLPSDFLDRISRLYGARGLELPDRFRR